MEFWIPKVIHEIRIGLTKQRSPTMPVLFSLGHCLRALRQIMCDTISEFGPSTSWEGFEDLKSFHETPLCTCLGTKVSLVKVSTYYVILTKWPILIGCIMRILSSEGENCDLPHVTLLPAWLHSNHGLFIFLSIFHLWILLFDHLK